MTRIKDKERLLVTQIIAFQEWLIESNLGILFTAGKLQNYLQVMSTPI